MRIEPNEKKKVKHELHNREVLVWNRTDKPITAYYTTMGLEIQ